MGRNVAKRKRRAKRSRKKNSAWSCANCRKNVDVEFDICWNCGSDRDGTIDPAFIRADASPPKPTGDLTSENLPVQEPTFATTSENDVRFHWPVAIIHFCCATYVVIRLLASAHNPVSSPDDNWIVGLFFVLLFPVNLLAVVGAFRIGFVSVLLVPVASAFWGYGAAKLVRMLRAK